MESEDVIGNAAAAELAGVRPDTWTSYVARDQAPRPYRREVVGSGHALPVWHRAELLAWLAGRKGQGYRSDLTASAREDHDGG